MNGRITLASIEDSTLVREGPTAVLVRKNRWAEIAINGGIGDLAQNAGMDLGRPLEEA